MSFWSAYARNFLGVDRRGWLAAVKQTDATNFGFGAVVGRYTKCGRGVLSRGVIVRRSERVLKRSFWRTNERRLEFCGVLLEYFKTYTLDPKRASG